MTDKDTQFRCEKCGLVARGYVSNWGAGRRSVDLDGRPSGGLGVGCASCKKKLVEWFEKEVVKKAELKATIKARHEDHDRENEKG